MSTRIKVLQAYNILESAVMVSQLNQTNRQEVSQALTLLRETALKSVSEPEPMTGTQLDARAEKAEIIAQGDDLATLAAIMPHLLHRRELARQYNHRPDDLMLGAIDKVNQKISEVLNFF